MGYSTLCSACRPDMRGMRTEREGDGEIQIGSYGREETIKGIVVVEEEG